MIAESVCRGIYQRCEWPTCSRTAEIGEHCKCGERFDHPRHKTPDVDGEE